MNTKHRKLAGVLATIAVMALAAGPSQAEPFKVVGSKARGVAAQQFGPWVVDLTPSAISALGSLLGPQPAPAAGPLSVTQSGTWSMNGTVQVGNPADDPALIRDVDKNERLAVHVDEHVDVVIPAATAEGPGVQKISVVQIPAGLRGVIEQATARVSHVEVGGVAVPVGPLDKVVVASLSTELLAPPPGFDGSVTHFLGIPDNVPFAATFQTRLYADPGTEVQIVLENFAAANVRVVADFSASAYAVVCLPPATGLSGTCPTP